MTIRAMRQLLHEEALCVFMVAPLPSKGFMKASLAMVAAAPLVATHALISDKPREKRLQNDAHLRLKDGVLRLDCLPWHASQPRMWQSRLRGQDLEKATPLASAEPVTSEYIPTSSYYDTRHSPPQTEETFIGCYLIGASDNSTIRRG